jgi:hypothetical protein
LVFLQKRTPAEIGADEEHQVFMAIADYVGHDRKGNPIFEDKNNHRVEKDDLPKILEKYIAFVNGELTKEQFTSYGYTILSKWLENYLVARRYLPKYISAIEELEKLQEAGSFELKTIDEIKESLFTGANISASDYVEYSPHKYLMTDCVTEYGINPAKFKYINEQSYNDNISKVIQESDIVINRAGAPGITTIFPKDLAGVMACGFAFVLRVKKGFDPYYVAAFLNSRLGRLQTGRYAFGSILEHITKDDLENVIIPFPKDKTLSRKIADDFREVVESQMKARIGFNKFFNNFEEIAGMES